MCVETSPPHASPSLDHIEVAMPKDLLKEFAEYETESSFRQGEPRWKYLARKGVQGAYDIAAEPLRASERLMQRLQPPTREEIQAEGPPTLGKGVGKLADVVMDVASTVPIVGDDAIMAKIVGKQLPMMFGTVAGTKKAIDMGATGAVTKKGTPVINNIFNWIQKKYEGILYTRPTGGFPEKGAQAKFFIFKGQAPGTGMKVGNLDSELRFLRDLDHDLNEAFRIYNSNPVLQEYLPKMYTKPRLGGNIMMVEQMKPMPWYDIHQLPIAEQRKMFINFAEHMEKIDAEFAKLDIHFFDDSTGNWGLTREGKPQIMDIGGMAGLYGQQQDTGYNLLRRATHYFSEGAYPPGNALDSAADMAGRLGKVTEQELSLPEFWHNMNRKYGLHGFDETLPPPKLKEYGVPGKDIPDPGMTPAFQKKADEILAAAKREGGPPGSRTLTDTESELFRRIELYKSMEKNYKSRHPFGSPLWQDDINRMKAELRRRINEQKLFPNDVVKEIAK